MNAEQKTLGNKIKRIRSDHQENETSFNTMPPEDEKPRRMWKEAKSK